MIPAARLCAKDLYQQLDWLAEGWNDEEPVVTRRLCRLQTDLHTFYRHNPERLAATLDLHRQLTHARITTSTPWRNVLVALRTLIATKETP